MDAIDSVPYIFPGATFTSDALRKMREEVFSEANGDRATAPNIAIILTGIHTPTAQHSTNFI